MWGAFFWVATGLGFLAGIVHAIHIVSSQWSLPGRNARAMAIYRAAWAIVLWTLFGSYLTALWILGLILRAITVRPATAN